MCLKKYFLFYIVNFSAKCYNYFIKGGDFSCKIIQTLFQMNIDHYLLGPILDIIYYLQYH